MNGLQYPSHNIVQFYNITYFNDTKQAVNIFTRHRCPEEILLVETSLSAFAMQINLTQYYALFLNITKFSYFIILKIFNL